MAIYRCEITPLSRSDGRNSVASSAYRAGVSLSDQCDFFTKKSKNHNYTRRGGVVASGIVLPPSAPEAFRDRQALWNAQERAESRKNSRIAREALLSLPHELTDEKRHDVTLRYAKHLMERYSVACDYAIHRPHKGGDSRNHHAHIMFTTRRITPEGMGEKTRELDDKKQGKEEIKHLRKAWETLCNEAIADVSQERIDCRSLQDQGIDRIPEPKQGVIATKMERQVRISYAGEERRAVKAYNDAIERMEHRDRERHVHSTRIALKRLRGANRRIAPWLIAQTRLQSSLLIQAFRTATHRAIGISTYSVDRGAWGRVKPHCR